jgi:hypothetical protein
MTMHISGFIMDEYAWKLEVPANVWWKSPISNLIKIFGTVLVQVYLQPYVNQALLWMCVAQN